MIEPCLSVFVSAEVSRLKLHLYLSVVWQQRHPSAQPDAHTCGSTDTSRPVHSDAKASDLGQHKQASASEAVPSI